MVAQHVVDQLEVVQVKQGDAGVHVLRAQVVLVEAAVVRTGKRVAVQQLVGKAREAFRVDGLRVQKHAFLAVHLNVAHVGKVLLVAHAQRMRLVAAVVQHLFAHLAHADASVATQQAELLFVDVVGIKQAHHRVDFPQTVHLATDLVVRHGNGSFIFRARFVNVDVSHSRHASVPQLKDESAFYKTWSL